MGFSPGVGMTIEGVLVGYSDFTGTIDTEALLRYTPIPNYGTSASD